MPYVLLVWLHVVAAVTWIGGMIFVGAILAPIGRTFPPAERARLLHGVGVRFSAVGWACVVILLITGPWMLSIRGRMELLADPAGLAATPVGRVLAGKLGMILVMVLLSLLHDCRWGPRLVAALLTPGNPTSAEAPRWGALRRRVVLLARLNLVLGVLVVALGVMLGRM